MTLRVTNTLSGEKEPFEPADPESVLLYVCGLTVYDPAHLGHARLWVHADVMDRWLSARGYDVRHVENFTDVNEKIVAQIGADERGDSEDEVAQTFIRETVRDMRSLNLKRAEVYPRVSEHVPEIIDLVETLIEKGYAYESGGSVYFDVTEFEEYGKLSNQNLDELEEQGDPDERSEKRHPADFALWKTGAVPPEDLADHRPAEADSIDEASGETWESPWSEGRPGWHIECSAMSRATLGETLDIHVAGQDIAFPHNENEIAQSEAATGERFARYWLHVRLLETDDEKMSSSLGNYATVEEAVAELGANVVRTFLLSASYSQRQTYSDATIEEAVDRWERLERAHERAVAAIDGPDARAKVEDGELRETVVDAKERFETAMDDDFNTREALSALAEIATALNTHLDANGVYDYRGLKAAIEAFEELGGEVLGLVFGGSGADGTGGGDGEVRLADELVELVLDVRESERAAGNYDRADDLRAELEALGVTIEDTDDGPRFDVGDVE
ncbi:cysteine--tRNA ligase [Halococcus salifodinae]|uniref:Cysteine--tRNA ligase n=1 Tax=Halococcus salifodinae DSM 8989 TaxID=1227456 RepID=M0MYQ4_9EURY|nr:cysteine--tRNA ligase [Halococcus salifodinae]EMA50862.1 cysteinyl-tRNA synthetase [Halococcus salifodinae DSM 8989]